MKKVTKLWDAIVVTVTLATLFLGTSAMVIGGIFFLFYFLAIRPQWKKVPDDRPVQSTDIWEVDAATPEELPTGGGYLRDTGCVSESLERRSGRF